MLILCLQNRSSIIEYYSLFLSFFRTQLSRTKKIVCDSMFVRILAQFLYSFAAHLNLKFECMLKKSFSFSFLDLVSANPRFHSLLFFFFSSLLSFSTLVFSFLCATDNVHIRSMITSITEEEVCSHNTEGNERQRLRVCKHSFEYEQNTDTDIRIRVIVS